MQVKLVKCLGGVWEKTDDVKVMSLGFGPKIITKTMLLQPVAMQFESCECWSDRDGKQKDAVVVALWEMQCWGSYFTSIA